MPYSNDNKYSFIINALISGFLLCSPVVVRAVESTAVQGLFKDKAVVKIDGKQRMLKIGKASPEGVLLISADSDVAELEVDGQRGYYQLGTGVSTKYTKPVQTAVQIWRDNRGMYRTIGSINGMTVEFLVDTGATTVAMNEQQAKRLGLDYRLSGEPRYVRTASGIAQGFRIHLNAVKVGAIELLNVEAIVLTGKYPVATLLGMSFLSRLELTHQGDVLELKKIH
jgi:aspartyl protease family protein